MHLDNPADPTAEALLAFVRARRNPQHPGPEGTAASEDAAPRPTRLQEVVLKDPSGAHEWLNAQIQHIIST
ncbi:hypothetical protein AURDEDRAFT_112065 [Auricularia subglabra TFB-10046 SS5]|nr:hypothetical protein AURDEDRAFT_112065 [Auricularia subglabra TFB-10046 SS5]